MIVVVVVVCGEVWGGGHQVLSSAFLPSSSSYRECVRTSKSVSTEPPAVTLMSASALSATLDGTGLDWTQQSSN